MSEPKSIGIFDSGFGGFSVLLEAYHRLPQERYLYYADTDHVPYGNKTNEQILAYSDDAVRFLIRRGADAVIIACNTASAVAASAMRARYDLPIIAMEPAIRPALKDDASGRILVMATPVTLREEKLKNLIRREHAEDRIDLLPMPKLVELAEKEDFSGEDARDYITVQLSDYALEHYSAIVLGCTHFNYFKSELRKVLHETFSVSIPLIEGSEGTLRRTADLLGCTFASESDEPAAYLASFYRSGRRGGAALPENTSFYRSGRPITDSDDCGHIARLLEQLEDCRREG